MGLTNGPVKWTLAVYYQVQPTDPSLASCFLLIKWWTNLNYFVPFATDICQIKQ